MSDLLLKSGGKLVELIWNSETKTYDENLEVYPLHCLFKSCKFTEEVTLRDIFLLLSEDIDIYSGLMSKHVKEIVEDGLSGKPVNNGGLQYLELCYEIEISKWSKENLEIQNCHTPIFHGIGLNDNGETTRYVLDLSYPHELVDLPLKLNDKINLNIWNYSKTNDRKIFKECDVDYYLLGQILYSIIYEFSFFGSAKEKEKFEQDILEFVKEIEEHPERLISMDDFMDELEKDND